jgi:hypothetical protein
MQDVYLMNKTTGEIVPSVQVFKDFYKTHSIKDSVFDEWENTEILVENTSIQFPNFADAIQGGI